MSIITDAIRAASQAYYTSGDSSLSDAEFDKLLEQEKQLDPNSPVLAVGHGLDISKIAGNKIKHRYGLAGSLDKCHNWKELSSSLKGAILVPSVKLDGMSVVLYYVDSNLDKAVTRGNGEVGIDITDKVKAIFSNMRQPFYLKCNKFTGAVRGEILMTNANFEIYQATHQSAKNARNTTAGLINSKNIEPEIDLLTIVVYTVVGCENSYLPFVPTYIAMHEWLSNEFSEVVPCFKPYEYWKTKHKFEEEMKDLSCYDSFDIYPTDGIVLTDNSIHLNANYQVEYNANAFKFRAESKETTVNSVEWALSKTKYLVPRVKFDTIELSGTNVTYATGFNAKYIKDNKIGPGSKVEVLKSGEIIPYIDKVIEPSPHFALPEECPCCHSFLTWEGVHLKCPNIECADADIQDLLVWMTNVSPMDGLGDTLKLQFLKQYLPEECLNLDYIYNSSELEFNDSHLVKLSLFHKMYHGLFHNKVSIQAALLALNVPRLGEVTASKLSEHREVIESLANIAEKFDIEFINSYRQELGEANVSSFLEFSHKFRRLQYIWDNIEWNENETEKKGKVAITGKLSIKRSDFEKELRAKGYLLGSISKDTLFLITDDPNSNSSKNKFADEHNITKITEEQFRVKYLS